MGGNLGEIGLMVGASALGLAAPVTSRQILAEQERQRAAHSMAGFSVIVAVNGVALRRPDHPGGEQPPPAAARPATGSRARPAPGTAS